MDPAEIVGNFLRILPQAIVSGVALGSVYALIAQGYYVTFTTTETVNFAQGEFLMVGALTSFTLLVLNGVNFVVALIVVMLLMAAMGMAVERVAIRPLRQLSSVGWVLSTVGVSVILRQFAEIYWGREQKRVPSIFGDTPITLGNVGIFPQEIFIILASLLTMALLLVFLKRSTFGKALQAVAFNPAAAGLMGINVRQMIVVAYVISSILAGIAGMLVAPIIFAHAEMGALLGLKAFAAAIIGGIENPIGILVVGIGLGIAEFIAAGINASFRDAATFLILILLLAWRPQGLFRRVTAEKV
jgi:branched-chain amino acid transport system permease protein